MNKIKFCVIGLTLIFLLLPATSAINQTNNNDQKTDLQLSFFNNDRLTNIKSITLNKDDVNLFEDLIDEIIDKLESMENYDIKEIIEQLIENIKNSKLVQKLKSLLESIKNFKPLQKGVFVISNGYGSKINLFSKRDISLRKNILMWHYLGNTNKLMKSRTVIIDPVPDSQMKFTKILNGWQVGLVNKFTGLYIRLPGSIVNQKECHTFFIGYASKIRSIDLPDITLPRLQ